MSLYNFDMNKDWMSERNKAAANGDKAAARQAELNRNQKIDALALNLPKTYTYIDIGDEAKGLMQNNAPAYMIGELMDARENKAKTTPQYQKYANDEIQDEMARYYFNGISGAGGNYENRPVYENKRQTTVDELWDTVMNTPKFSYDTESDPVFQSYKDMYQREGQRAMQDTLASLSIGAGGDNSWAVSAAAQAQNRYMQELADKVPELYNLAYERYLNEKNADMNKLELARDLENTDYNRYLNEMNIFQNDRAYADSLYDDYYNQSRTDKQWDYNTAQTELANYIQAGVMPPEAVLKRAGIEDASYVKALIEQIQADDEYNRTVRGYDIKAMERNDQLGKLELDEAVRQLAEQNIGGVGEKETKKKLNNDEANDKASSEYQQNWQGSENYQTVAAACENMLAAKGKTTVLEYLKDLKKQGAIDQTTFMVLTNKYRG